MMAEYIAKLERLIRHTWVHSGYPKCGYNQMTTEEKRLFDKITMNKERIPMNPQDKTQPAHTALPCEHNNMVETGDPQHAWKCADCGYIYGNGRIMGANAADQAMWNALQSENIQLRAIMRELLAMDELEMGDESLLPPEHPVAQARAVLNRPVA